MCWVFLSNTLVSSEAKKKYKKQYQMSLTIPAASRISSKLKLPWPRDGLTIFFFVKFQTSNNSKSYIFSSKDYEKITRPKINQINILGSLEACDQKSSSTCSKTMTASLYQNASSNLFLTQKSTGPLEINLWSKKLFLDGFYKQLNNVTERNLQKNKSNSL